MTRYKLMRSVLVYLTHLDYEDTQNIMMEKLTSQVDTNQFNWNKLNTLCWAIGSIADTQRIIPYLSYLTLRQLSLVRKYFWLE